MGLLSKKPKTQINNNALNSLGKLSLNEIFESDFEFEEMTRPPLTLFENDDCADIIDNARDEVTLEKDNENFEDWLKRGEDNFSETNQCEYCYDYNCNGHDDR